MRRFAALLAFLRSETAGGMILILSAILALVWANSSAGPSYRALLQFRLGPETVHVWVNDGLMAIFFLLVGLELRREMTRGELASLGRVAAPALAALGGMIVPAMIFSAFNYHDRFNMRGWAVPVATDIAFALAVLNVLGNRVPIALKVFLTALAIIDDLGAIIVIALFYTNDLDLRGLGAACVAVAALWAMARLGVRALWPYLAGGVVLWMLRSSPASIRPCPGWPWLSSCQWSGAGRNRSRPQSVSSMLWAVGSRTASCRCSGSPTPGCVSTRCRRARGGISSRSARRWGCCSASKSGCSRRWSRRPSCGSRGCRRG